MPALTDGAERAMQESKTAAQNARAEFTKLRNSVIESGVDVGPGSDAFAKLDAAGTALATADDAASQAASHYMRIVELEGGSVPRDLGASTGDARARVPMDAASTIMQGDEYSQIKNILERSGKAGFGGTRSLGEAMNRKGFMNALTTGASGTSGGAHIENDRNPYVDIPGRPVGILGWVTVGSTDSDLVEYARLTGRPSSAAFTAEATTVVGGSEDGLKPEGSAAFELVQAPVETVAEILPVTRRAFADAGQLRTILDKLLLDDLRRATEAGIYTGSGTSPQLKGIMNTAGINTVAYSASYDLAQQIRRGLTQIRLGFEEPDYIAMNPADAEKLAFFRGQVYNGTATAQGGDYLYGGPQQGGIPTLWGKTVIEDALITEGRVLIGTKNAATLWVREGASVMVSDSHKDWFQRNVLAMLAEARVAFGVQRPKAFCDVDVAA